uniref:Uncharacterized protein AlNc14C16G1788 n=1 Tax=Albugo laibachii Nc14 TaxID=890382 RepID=F0W4B7_9STRA|nr:conserved hypothetical protein [Albugo laibachii Nc14]|eukprot:CCA15950.1 conserved hypothetical protein [Albugo laibachii Nc14]
MPPNHTTIETRHPDQETKLSDDKEKNAPRPIAIKKANLEAMNLATLSPSNDLAMRAILSPSMLADNPKVRRRDSMVQLQTEAIEATPVEPLASDVSIGRDVHAVTVKGSRERIAAQRGRRSSPDFSAYIRRIETEEDHPVMIVHPDLPPPPFANMTFCDNCREDIGTLLTRGRHHCRNCGGSFCSNCSSKMIVVPFQVFLSKGEQRVCDSCYYRIKEFHSQLDCTHVTWNGLPPISKDQLRKEFQLGQYEKPVTIFHCCYFMDLAPFYGHLFLTRCHVCFRPYRLQTGCELKVAYGQVEALVKPDFYYINALQVNTQQGTKYFFAEFNGLRDLCFLRMDQLIRANQEGLKHQSLLHLDVETLSKQADTRRQTYCNTVPHLETSEIPLSQHSEKAAGVDEFPEGIAIPFVPMPPDGPLSKMTMLLDCELAVDLKAAFDLLWNDGIGHDFFHHFLMKTQDIDIDIESWQAAEEQTRLNVGFEISKEADYSLFRHVRSQHPPKVTFPGLPPYATCHRIQRFRLDTSESSTASGASTVTWNRFIISEINRMSKIPFSDYFEIETRWVFSRDGCGFSHVEVGVSIHYLRSTWFRSQINSSTISESKEVFRLWGQLTLCHLEKNRAPPPFLSVCEGRDMEEEMENDVIAMDGSFTLCSDSNAAGGGGHNWWFKSIGMLFCLMIVCVVVNISWSILVTYWGRGNYAQILKIMRSLEAQLQAQEEALNELRQQNTCAAK